MLIISLVLRKSNNGKDANSLISIIAIRDNNILSLFYNIY